MSNIVEADDPKFRAAVQDFLKSPPPAKQDAPRCMPLSDTDLLRGRVTVLESEVAALRAELAELRRETLGYRGAATERSADALLGKR